jgi:hypothetical protein
LLVPQTTVSWIWFPEWANNPKRQARYAEFQGERVYLFSGSAKQITSTGIQNEDTWKTNE